MFLNDTTSNEKLAALTKKLKSDFGVIIPENKSLTALKRINESASTKVNELSSNLKNAKNSKDFAMNQLISECSAIMINQKEKQITESVITITAPTFVLESYLAGVSLKAVFSDLKNKLHLSESQLQDVADNFVKKVEEDYNSAIELKTNWDEVNRRLPKKKISLAPSGVPIADPEFEKDLEKVKAHHEKNKDKKDTKLESSLAESIYKNARVLLETNVEEAEIMMSTKGFSRNLQEMIEKLGRMTNENLPPVTDHIRVVYGLDAATNFQESTHEVLQSVMDALYSAKFFIDEAVIRMSEHKVPGVSNDMETEVSDSDFGLDASTGDSEEIGMDQEFEMPSEVSDLEEPLGRAKKESVAQLKKKLEEMTSAYNRLLESKTKKKF
jgi:hypothetical protein